MVSAPTIAPPNTTIPGLSVDESREDETQLPAGVPDSKNSGLLAAEDVPDHVARPAARQPLRVQSAGKRSSTCESLQATRVAAPADYVVVAGDVDVSHISCRALRPQIQLPVRDDAGADTGADLDEDQWVWSGKMTLSQGHHVDVVVDEHRAMEVLPKPVSYRETIPARHDRRTDGPAAGELNRPRKADAEAPQLGLTNPDAAEQLFSPLGNPFQRRRWPDGDDPSLHARPARSRPDRRQLRGSPSRPLPRQQRTPPTR